MEEFCIKCENEHGGQKENSKHTSYTSGRRSDFQKVDHLMIARLIPNPNSYKYLVS